MGVLPKDGAPKTLRTLKVAAIPPDRVTALTSEMELWAEKILYMLGIAVVAFSGGLLPFLFKRFRHSERVMGFANIGFSDSFPKLILGLPMPVLVEFFFRLGFVICLPMASKHSKTLRARVNPSANSL